MELHQLRYFVAVADHRSFTRAAEACFVAQPSLSQQIIKLEKELGHSLFDRLGRKVQLTTAGRVLYEQAVQVLATVDAAPRLLNETAEAGRLVVGAIPTVAPYLLPGLLQQFRGQVPQAEVVIYENLTAEIVRGCCAGEIDVGLLALPIEADLLEVEPLFREELRVAVPAQHPLADKRRVTMADLGRHPFILLDEAHCLGEQIVSFCRQQACLPAVSCRSSQLLTVQELVGLGYGISLVPEMACQQDSSQRRVYRSLSGVKPLRTIGMIRHRHRHQSRLAEQFQELARSVLGEAGGLQTS